MKRSNNAELCSWCGRETDLPAVYAAKVPIMEEIEEKINKFCDEVGIEREKIWGEKADWNSINLPTKIETMLLTYDDLCNDAEKRVVCGDCLIEDNMLWLKYYDTRNTTKNLDN